MSIAKPIITQISLWFLLTMSAFAGVVVLFTAIVAYATAAPWNIVTPGLLMAVVLFAVAGTLYAIARSMNGASSSARENLHVGDVRAAKSARPIVVAPTKPYVPTANMIQLQDTARVGWEKYHWPILGLTVAAAVLLGAKRLPHISRAVGHRRPIDPTHRMLDIAVPLVASLASRYLSNRQKGFTASDTTSHETMLH